MLNLSKYLLLVISILQIFISQVGALNGKCEKITSTECSFLPTINTKKSKEDFDKSVRERYDHLKLKLIGDSGNSCDVELSSKVRYLKTLACAIIIKEEGCTGSTTVCPDVCTKISESLNSAGCFDIEGKSSINSQCSARTAPLNDCLSYYNVETKTCGFENAEAKAEFCAQAQNTDESCCNVKTETSETKTPTTISAGEKKEEAKSHTKDTSDDKKKKSGSFFTSKVFIVILILIILIIAVLAYFYYVGSKDEKEERMRNLELGNRGYVESLYHGNNDSGIERKLSSGYNYGSEDYNLSGSNYNYHKKSEDENPFDDSNRISTYSRRLSTKHNGDDDEDNDYLNKSYNSKPIKYVPFETSYNDVQNTISNNELLVAPPDVHNPFESPKFEEDSMDMQLNNFPMPYNNYEKPKDEEININSSVPANATTTNAPTTTTTIPADKDINIGDDILKPSVVTLTEIKTPEENNISDEKEIETPKEPKKGIVNMIDIQKPSSNEAVKTNNGLTPSILITNVNGDVSSIDPEESITEEISEMPEPKPFRAIHAYEPEIDDELRLEVDNEIDVLYEYDDGWCWAINKTTGEQGACPLLCLVSAKEAINGDHGWEKDMEIVKVPGRRESMLSFDSSNISFSLPRNMSLPRNKQQH